MPKKILKPQIPTCYQKSSDMFWAAKVSSDESSLDSTCIFRMDTIEGTVRGVRRPSGSQSNTSTCRFTANHRPGSRLSTSDICEHVKNCMITLGDRAPDKGLISKLISMFLVVLLEANLETSPCMLSKIYPVQERPRVPSLRQWRDGSQQVYYHTSYVATGTIWYT
jgi:hypothetical protein